MPSRGRSSRSNPLLESRFETLHADEDTAAARIPLGHQLAVQLETTAWSNRDIAEHGWRSVAGITADRGDWHLSARASWNGVDGRFGGGRYTDYGVSLARTLRMSRWMTAWIALSIAHRQWSDTPPAGERNGTAVMLTIGTTFR